MYNSVNFSKFTELGTQCHNPALEYFHHHRKNPLAHLQSPCIHTPSPRQSVFQDVLHHSLAKLCTLHALFAFITQSFHGLPWASHGPFLSTESSSSSAYILNTGLKHPSLSPVLSGHPLSHFICSHESLTVLGFSDVIMFSHTSLPCLLGKPFLIKELHQMPPVLGCPVKCSHFLTMVILLFFNCTLKRFSSWADTVRPLCCLSLSALILSVEPSPAPVWKPQ